jgi:hypothetical protein
MTSQQIEIIFKKREKKDEIEIYFIKKEKD